MKIDGDYEAIHGKKLARKDIFTYGSTLLAAHFYSGKNGQYKDVENRLKARK
ncbi:hypothetical protein [Pokkaliibacter plantistimulans]|uniref:hypothetical protein n=1 Tax=Pokkaliibacter plantistimulans TaxID=1635171 RepID=UPI002D782B8A|nr:hypothetical protein [Pokkaliibacter plantistimulans]